MPNHVFIDTTINSLILKLFPEAYRNPSDADRDLGRAHAAAKPFLLPLFIFPAEEDILFPGNTVTPHSNLGIGAKTTGTQNLI